MRKDFIAEVCHYGWGAIRMGRERKKRADIQKSIIEVNKGLETKMNEVYSILVQYNGFVKT